ncbi:DNA-directed RNA polymerase subunit E'' [Candidatus Woesearchaeota archaeon]|nr:MAG: DNA-directed RNA polymerase subunit E'' [Candidatus Woesearchaeota archaeon]
MKKKVCKTCKLFVESNECPLCKGNQFTESWKGRVIITDPEKSKIAQFMNIKAKGEYAIRIG